MTSAPAKTCPVCGQRIVERTDREHNHHFAAIRAARFFWPEQHPFKPHDDEHLRGYLYVKVGYVRDVVIDIGDFEGDPSVLAKAAVRSVAIARRLLSPGTYLEQEIINGGTAVRVRGPASISYKAADRKNFREVAAKVHSLIEVTCGYAVERLIREMKNQTD